MNARLLILVAGLAFVLFAAPVGTQEAGASPLEMRHFWHVFIAYAVAWLFIAGWLFTIVKRLRRIEERLR